MSDSANYEYFGLSPTSAERDLDNAYRQLAKKMHPDKNGGTEEAKMRFQAMKERYEALKARRGSNIEEVRNRKMDECAVSSSHRHDGYDEDDADAEGKGDRCGDDK